jgi:Family of unknown function (DUF5677)
MDVTKEQIADWSIRLGRIAIDIGQQLNKSQVSGFSKYLLGLTSRQAIILQDIHFILKDNQESQLTSAFILFRCLLEDFITVLYFETGKFNNEELACHTAEAERQKFKMYSESKEINENFFEGKNEFLANQEYIDSEIKDFKSNTDNDILLVDKAKFKFKRAPSVTDMIAKIPERNVVLAKPNIHAFVIWKLLSTYVHYSLFNYQLETSPEIRKIEINQCQEILSYCFKCLSIVSDQLNVMGFKHDFRDPSHVYKEIFSGFNS